MSEGITIIKKSEIIRVQSSFPILPQYSNYSFTVSFPNQTAFTLPSYPNTVGLFVMTVNGVMQNPLIGDYTVNGLTLTYNPGSSPLNVNDVVAGFYQVQSPINNPAIMNYRQFYFEVGVTPGTVAGQRAFTLPSVASLMILVSVNGTSQNQLNGDFTIVGNVLTLSQGLNLNDNLFGIYIQQ